MSELSLSEDVVEFLAAANTYLFSRDGLERDMYERAGLLAFGTPDPSVQYRTDDKIAHARAQFARLCVTLCRMGGRVTYCGRGRASHLFDVPESGLVLDIVAASGTVCGVFFDARDGVLSVHS